MKINLKKLFVTTVIGAGLFVSQPAHAFAGYDFDYIGFQIEQDTLKRTFDYYNQVTGTNDILEKVQALRVQEAVKVNHHHPKHRLNQNRQKKPK